MNCRSCSLVATTLSTVFLLSASAWAQGVEVNEAEWESLPQQEQEAIQGILRASKLLPEAEAEIMAVEGAPSAEQALQEMMQGELAELEESGTRAGVPGANIGINADDWGNLTADEQTEITEIMQSAGLVPEEAGIIPTEAARPSEEIMREVYAQVAGDEELEELFGIRIPKWVCRGACDAAAGVAIAGCAGLTGGTAIAVCTAASEGGRRLCKSRC